MTAAHPGWTNTDLNRTSGAMAKFFNPLVAMKPHDDTVARAIRARRPRTRYAVGAGAKPIILARRILTDRAFDALMRRAFRLDNRNTDNQQPLRA